MLVCLELFTAGVGSSEVVGGLRAVVDGDLEVVDDNVGHLSALLCCFAGQDGPVVDVGVLGMASGALEPGEDSVCSGLVLALQLSDFRNPHHLAVVVRCVMRDLVE